MNTGKDPNISVFHNSKPYKPKRMQSALKSKQKSSARQKQYEKRGAKSLGSICKRCGNSHKFQNVLQLVKSAAFERGQTISQLYKSKFKKDKQVHEISEADDERDFGALAPVCLAFS